MRLISNRHLLMGSVCIALAACGGSGGGGTNFIPPPPLTSTPTPTPTPEADERLLQIFPAITDSAAFASVGYEIDWAGTVLTGDAFSVRYDGSTDAYVMDVPGGPPGTIYEYTHATPNATWWTGNFTNAGWLGMATVLKPSNPELELTYTTMINYDMSGMGGEPSGWFAFGTAASAVPVSGAATYSALVRGSSFDGNGYIRGSAELTFDFSAGQLSGHLNPEYAPLGGMGESYSLGRYDFVNTVFGVGSTIFSGEMSHSTLPIGGSFNGQFTGPAAQELMARWTASFRDPLSNQDSQMFGVWVGRR